MAERGIITLQIGIHGIPVTHEGPIYDDLRWGALSTLHGSPAVPGPGALGGDNTAAILREIGYGDADVSRLYAGGVVWSEERQRLG